MTPALAAGAAEPLSREGIDFFERKIRPVLLDHCYSCHSAQSDKVRGGFLLDSREGLLRGGDHGPALIPGDPDASLLIQAIRHTDKDFQMPPKEKLSETQIRDFEQWIQMGAPDPRDHDPERVARYGYDFEVERRFWSFQPVSDPAPPPVENDAWATTPIDRFILAKLEEYGMQPAPDAGKRTLIRRVTFDLTGLPPTPEEIEDFLQDDSADAFEKVVERLLASPHYGERWGRHWLDVVRYADTSGCNSDFPVPSAYKYRNYVIDSFNRDKPYDQFIREQLAGDLMDYAGEEQRYERIIATGLLAISRRFGSRNNEFHLTIEDTLDTLGQSVLGLALSCARCHDHKYDPIPTRDYYALYGIFDSTRYAFPGTEIYRKPKDFIPLASGEEAERLLVYQAGLGALDEEIERLNERRRALERGLKELEDQSDTQGMAAHQKQLADARAELEQARTRLRDLEANPPPVDKAYAVADATPRNARIQKLGNPRSLGDEVPRGFLQILGGRELPEDVAGSGRLELAEWLFSNPLAARVMVNRIWHYHFGKGLVQTPNDFGNRGRRPTHPELLDYLASRFVESGWSVKAMHRLIIHSRAYQMSSRDNPAYAEADPNNDLLWKFDRRRLEAEEIRDAMLAVSGLLDRSVPEAHPFPPEHEWRYTQHRPFVAEYESAHRSVYLMQQRIMLHPFLEMFDGADPNVTTAERTRSTTPLQALFMMNSPFVHQQAGALAGRVATSSERAEQIDYAHQLAFGRPASPREITEANAFLEDYRARLGGTADARGEQSTDVAMAAYMRVLLSSNAFLFVD